MQRILETGLKRCYVIYTYNPMQVLEMQRILETGLKLKLNSTISKNGHLEMQRILETGLKLFLKLATMPDTSSSGNAANPGNGIETYKKAR